LLRTPTAYTGGAGRELMMLSTCSRACSHGVAAIDSGMVVKSPYAATVVIVSTPR